MTREIGLLTDSTSDVPVEDAERYKIEVVPAMIILGGKNLRDGVDITRSELYRRMSTPGIFPTTSTPSVGAFEQAYDSMLHKGFQKILSIHPAATLSGIFGSARTAALQFPGKVEVVDSGQVSLGTGFLAMDAAEAASNGATMEQLRELVETKRHRVQLVAMIESMTHLAHSGRVSAALAGIGNLLQIKLLISLLEGTVSRIGQVRTHARGLATLVDYVRGWEPLEKIAVVHANARDAADALIPLLMEKVNGFNRLFQGRPLLVEVTPAIGIHTGPGAVGIIAVSASNRS